MEEVKNVYLFSQPRNILFCLFVEKHFTVNPLFSFFLMTNDVKAKICQKLEWFMFPYTSLSARSSLGRLSFQTVENSSNQVCMCWKVFLDACRTNFGTHGIFAIFNRCMIYYSIHEILERRMLYRAATKLKSVLLRAPILT